MRIDNRKKNIIGIAAVMLGFSLILSACSGKAEAPEQASGVAEASGEESAASSGEKETVLVTEEDYRNALASADDDRKIAIYKEFAGSYKMTEDEYKDYADLCGKAGDTVSQREALFMLYRTDPTEEHGNLLSTVTLRITDADDDKAGELLTSLVEALKDCGSGDFSPEAAKEIIGSDHWKKSFYIDNGTFTSNTEYSGDARFAEVSADQLATRAVITSQDVRYLCDISFGGVSVGSVEVADKKSEGKYCYRQFDPEGVDIIVVNGYINDGHYVNRLDVTVGEVTYSGEFDDAGKTKEEQPEGFAGVVYAYAEDGSNYLYVENADAATWVAKAGEMGFGDF